MLVSIWRSSEASSFSWTFSWTTRSWHSETWFSLSISWWFSLRSQTTCDHSSSRCFCLRIRDLRADSLLDIILLCFLSLMRLSWCSSASSEVELLLKHDDCGLTSWTWWDGIWKLYNWLENRLSWNIDALFSVVMLKCEGYGDGFEGTRKWSPVTSPGCIVIGTLLRWDDFSRSLVGKVKWTMFVIEGEEKHEEKRFFIGCKSLIWPH